MKNYGSVFKTYENVVSPALCSKYVKKTKYTLLC